MSLNDALHKWRERIGEKRYYTVILVVLTGIASIAIRLLVNTHFDSSALLYVGIPFSISLLLAITLPQAPGTKWWHGYVNHLVYAFIVFFASSIILYEGFICVLFFIPVYLVIVSITFLIHWAFVSAERRSDKTKVSILPVLLIASSFEGTTESLSIDRESVATVTHTTSLTPAEIMENLAQPFDLQQDRHWMLSVFPMPYEIQAGSLNEGDVHVVKTRYHRWFVTNTHEGELHIEMLDVQPNYVRTRFVHDSTFFANYVTTHGTEILLEVVDEETTQITLKVHYRRDLDPAWYFGPLEHYGISRMADFLIEEIMVRGG